MLLLEQSEVYEDRVRGEWIAPWGVTEVKRLGLYENLVATGGHHITRHVTYDETRTPEARRRRRRHFERSTADPSLGAHAIAVMAGPETASPAFFTARQKARILDREETRP